MSPEDCEAVGKIVHREVESALSGVLDTMARAAESNASLGARLGEALARIGSSLEKIADAIIEGGTREQDQLEAVATIAAKTIETAAKVDTLIAALTQSTDDGEDWKNANGD